MSFRSFSTIFYHFLNFVVKDREGGGNVARKLTLCWIKLVLLGPIIVPSNVKGLVACLFSVLFLLHGFLFCFAFKIFQNQYPLVSKGVHVQR